ncbi:MAG: plant virulence effector HPE1-like domain-containing protein [Pararhizobium sp.]
MRSILFFAAFALMPATASAGAITAIHGPATSTVDITTIGCPNCVAAEKPVQPHLPTGHERIRVEQVDGKAKVFRTENWLGGSPVTYVSMADETEIAQLKRSGIDVAGHSQLIAPGTRSVGLVDVAARKDIDTHRTGALPHATAQAAAAAPFDAASLKLRLRPVEASE